jgi:hypothetical protein
MGWNDVSELLPPTSLLFIPQMIYKCGGPRRNDIDRTWRSRRKICSSATLCTTSTTWNDSGVNSGVCSERSLLTAWAMARTYVGCCSSISTYKINYKTKLNSYIATVMLLLRSRVSSGSIVSDYGLHDRAIGVRSPAGAKNFSSILCVQTGSGAHPASCTMGTGGHFPGCRARPGRDADKSPHLVPRSWMSRSYISSPPSASMACNVIASLFTFTLCYYWKHAQGFFSNFRTVLSFLQPIYHIYRRM